MRIIPKFNEEGKGQKMQKGWTPCQLEEADERPGREGSWPGTPVWERAKSGDEQDPDGEHWAGVALDRSRLAEAEDSLNKFD